MDIYSRKCSQEYYQSNNEFNDDEQCISVFKLKVTYNADDVLLERLPLHSYHTPVTRVERPMIYHSQKRNNDHSMDTVE